MKDSVIKNRRTDGFISWFGFAGYLLFMYGIMTLPGRSEWASWHDILVVIGLIIGLVAMVLQLGAFPISSPADKAEIEDDK